MMTTQQEVAERRKHPRITELFLVSYVNKEGSEQKTPVSMGRTLDISRSGARLEIDREVKPDSRMELDMAVRDTRLVVQGRVVRVERTEQGRYTVGIEFDTLQDALAGVGSA